MKKILSVIIGLFLLATIPLTYYAFHHNNNQTAKNDMSDPIKDGLKLYANQPLKTYTIDDYITLSELSRVTDQIPNKTLAALKQKYSDDPYKKLIDKNNFKNDLIFTQARNTDLKLEYYNVANVSISIHLYDSIFLKALYCDVSGYTNEDFEMLSDLDHRGSEYLSNSYLFALLLLQENQCYDNQVLTNAIEDSAQRMARTEDEDTKFTDIYAQRIVLLYWSGYGNLVKNDWIKKIRENYKPGVGWVGSGKLQTENRPTGLSLLGLLYYKAAKLHENLY